MANSTMYEEKQHSAITILASSNPSSPHTQALRTEAVNQVNRFALPLSNVKIAFCGMWRRVPFVSVKVAIRYQTIIDFSFDDRQFAFLA